MSDQTVAAFVRDALWLAGIERQRDWRTYECGHGATVTGTPCPYRWGVQEDAPSVSGGTEAVSTPEPSAAPSRYWRFFGWMVGHPCRLTYVIAELLRPLPFKWRVENAWFHIRHWDDIDAWRAHGERRGLDDSCT